MGWMDDMKRNTERYFDDFKDAAMSEELKPESLYPEVMASFDMQFEAARASE